MNPAITIGIGLGSFALGILIGPFVWRLFGFSLYATVPTPDINDVTCDDENGELIIDFNPKTPTGCELLDVLTEFYTTTEPPDPSTAESHGPAPSPLRVGYSSGATQNLKLWTKHAVYESEIESGVGPCEES